MTETQDLEAIEIEPTAQGRSQEPDKEFADKEKRGRKNTPPKDEQQYKNINHKKQKHVKEKEQQQHREATHPHSNQQKRITLQVFSNHLTNTQTHNTYCLLVP